MDGYASYRVVLAGVVEFGRHRGLKIPRDNILYRFKSGLRQNKCFSVKHLRIAPDSVRGFFIAKIGHVT
jgi:hypothetical protein